jgi:hypothetical protein
MRALSIRQPYAELILRGIKTAELRSRSTSIVGERFLIYAARGTPPRAQSPARGLPAMPWSRDLEVATPPAWMIELAEQLKLIEPELRGGTRLPTGVIVGSAVIDHVSPPDPGDPRGLFRWHLADVQRALELRKPRRHPQPTWFNPF